MRRNVFFLVMLMMVSLACSSASAKSRRDDMHKGYSGDRREMRMRMDKPKSVIRKNFLSFLMTAIRKLALYKLDL